PSAALADRAVSRRRADRESHVGRRGARVRRDAARAGGFLHAGGTGAAGRASRPASRPAPRPPLPLPAERLGRGAAPARPPGRRGGPRACRARWRRGGVVAGGPGAAGARGVTTSEGAPATVRTVLIRNTAWYGLVTFIGLGSGLVMSIVLARGLGPSLMGDYSYLLWALRMLTAIATLGWALATARYTAEACATGDRARAWGFVRFFLRRQFVPPAVVVAGVMAIVLAEVEPRLRLPFVLLALMLIPVTVESIYTHAVYGAQRYDLTTLTSTVKMALHLLASIVVVALGFGILGLVIVLFLGTVLSCWMQGTRARALLGGTAVAPTKKAHGEIRAYVSSLAVVAVLEALVRDRSEIFFLRMFAAPEEIAFYSLAFGLATRVMVVPEIAVGALLPALAALHGRGDRGEFSRVYRTAMRYVALSGAPIAALVAALAPGVIAWLYGAAYLPAARLLGGPPGG